MADRSRRDVVDLSRALSRLMSPARGRFVAIRQFNARPRPRCLAIGFYGAQLSRLEATLPGIRSINSISDVHQADWDLLICDGGDVRDVASNLFVIAFGGLLIDKAHGVDGSAVIVRQVAFEEKDKGRRPVSVAVEFSTPDVVPTRFEALISSDLVRIVAAEHWHSTLSTYHPTDDGVGEPSREIEGVERLLVRVRRGDLRRPLQAGVARPGVSRCPTRPTQWRGWRRPSTTGIPWT